MLVEPLPNHLVSVQPPVRLIGMIIETRLNLSQPYSLSFVGSCCAGEV